MNKINVTGINFDNISLLESIEIIDKNIKNNINNIVYTPNVEIAYACVNNNSLLDIINSATLILPDGDGIVKASKILKTPIKCKTPGVEFGYELFRYASNNKLSVYLLGGKEETVVLAKNEIEKDYNAFVCGIHSGYFDNNDVIINDINKSKTDILIVCMGFPKQEKWVYDNIKKLDNIKVIACLGGSIDIYSKKVKRAPVIFRKLKLEWLYRTIVEPKRIKRILVIPKYFNYVRKLAKQQN